MEDKGLVDRLKTIIKPGDRPSGESKYGRVHVIINPSLGKEAAILNILNDVFHNHRIDWEAFVTHKSGDAQNLTEHAIKDRVDAVAVYGGDGTVMEVACGLEGREIPIAILPGGRANLLAKELGIPLDLRAAAELIANPIAQVRPLDMGAVDGYPFFRLGIGFQADGGQAADQEVKSARGVLSYAFSLLRNLDKLEPAHYRLTLDGETVEVDAVGCMVTTYGKTAAAGTALAHTIDPDDGLLDVLVIQEANLKTFLKAAADAVLSGDMADALMQWQVQKVSIAVTPPLPIVRDGEEITPEALDIHAVPQAVRIIVPSAEE